MSKERFVLLTDAMNAVSERGSSYGTVEENFGRIAGLWSVLLEKDVTPAQVALCLAALKMARLMQTPDHRDSWVDLAGYAGCGGEITHGDKRQGELLGVGEPTE